jgi:hypothetical protein
MDELAKKRIDTIMEAPVANLVKLTDSQFDLVLVMLYAARLFRPSEVKPIEIKREVKHGRKH